MREIWMPVEGYEGLYEVSNLGVVRRLPTKASPGTGHYAREGRIVISHSNNKGYHMVDLWKDNKRKQFLVHRLVAVAFIENPDKFPEVNHKDENPENNRADNLEWCNRDYNMNYGTCGKRIGIANSKAVLQFDLQGNLLKRYSSTMEAQRETGVRTARISECCNGKRKRGGGFVWRYAK